LSFIYAMLVFKKGEFNLNVTNSAPIRAKEIESNSVSPCIQYIARSASCVSIETHIRHVTIYRDQKFVIKLLNYLEYVIQMVLAHEEFDRGTLLNYSIGIHTYRAHDTRRAARAPSRPRAFPVPATVQATETRRREQREQ